MTPRRDRPHTIPPRFGVRLLKWLLPDIELAEVVGDFEERFRTKVRERGAAAARIWYGVQILRLVPYLVKDHILWSWIMFKNNLIIAWRNIKRSKVYSALNVLGLAAGMAVFILIMLYVRYELSYDRYHVNARNIYRVVNEKPGNVYLGSNVFAVTPGPLAAAMVRDFPEVLQAARIKGWSNILVSVGDGNFLERSVHWADSQIFEMFSFPVVRGDGGSALKDPSSVLLSESAARRFFGGSDPVGRTISLQLGNRKAEFKVAGVFGDIPVNSHFTMDVVGPFETMGKLSNTDLTLWGSNDYYTYILLKDGADPKALEAELVPFIAKYEGRRYNGQHSRYFLQPLTRIHLHSRANFDFGLIGDARFVLLFASIAVLVLVIACVNYMNLAAARSLKRAKEVGLRKVVGAGKGQLVRQFLGDAMALTFLALVFAVGLVLAALPAFRTFVERDIVFNPFRDAALMPALVLLAAAVGAAAGSYPALFVSSFRPVTSLKGTGTARAKGRGLRNGLIVFQFAASTALIICTVGVKSQLAFIRNKDMGYDRDQILVLTPRGGIRSGLEAFKNELRSNPAVVGVTSSSDLPNKVNSRTFADWPGKPEDVRIPIYTIQADYEFPELYGLDLVRGRSFSRDFPADAGGAYLINETAWKALGWEDPIGREFGRRGRDWAPWGRIVGVIKDFHMHSLHLSIMPLSIFLDPARANQVSIKLRGGDIPDALAFVRKTWEKFAPEYPFEYDFFNDIFDRAYRTDQRLGTIFSAFAGLAIFIACLGLVGLASFAAERKTKEIGIRKVLGASISGVIALLSRDFLKWVVLANVIAWPIGYFAMRSWLGNFAYRTSLTVPMFLGASLAAFAIAAAVIGLRTYRAAAANPADSIRYE